MATTSTRRPISRQPTKLAKSHPVTTPDQLANDLATKLTISKKKDEGESKTLSMRAVNEASQALTSVVQSGWKKSSKSNTLKTTFTTANSAASKAAKHLLELRRILPGDLDVERAASSILGKLVVLEMFEQAKAALSDMQPRICSILSVSVDHSNLLIIPEPSSPPTNPIVLNLISVYLFYAIIIMAQPDCSAQDLSAALKSPNMRSLLSWLPFLSSLPAKHTDSLLTRAYTAINTLCSSSASSSTRPKPAPSPESVFILRTYALRCLAHTTPGTIDANTFWNQATRYTGVFVKATPPKGEEQTTSMILHAFDELVQLAEQRADRDGFLAVEEKGKGFLGFCEQWISFANRAGDIALLKKIIEYMKQPSSSSPTPSRVNTPSSEKKILEKEVILEGTKACSLFSQALLVLENSDTSESDLLHSLRECTEVLEISETMDILLQPELRTLEVKDREQQAALRMCGKVDRALEKLRRCAIKYIEAHPVSSPGQTTNSSIIDDSLRALLTATVNCFQSVLTSADLNAASTRDLLTRSIDTLFVMSRTKLNVNDSSSFVSAFDSLSLAVAILNTVQQDKFPISPASQSVDVANYMRCISGAFYNIAGSLYQANRYGNAVPFLVESCELGAKALRLPRPVQDPPNESREKEWQSLEQQLFRRWEILGVCYTKNSDRKNAFNAFKRSIHTFPFHSSGLTAQCDRLPPESLFDSSASPAIKQLVSLIDRVSYTGACDLLLPPEEVSLLSAINCAPSPKAAHGAHPTILEPCVTGALLERQLDSLEPSLWKEGVRGVSVKLIQDALSVYSTKEEGDAKSSSSSSSSNSMPVRKARILVRCLELLYREQGEGLCTVLGFGNVEEIGETIERLLSSNSLGKDVHLAQYVSQYRITGHLWMALHAHRRADPLQISIMSQHTDDAYKLMKDLLSHTSEGATPKTSRTPLSPKLVKKIASPKVVGRIVSPKPTRVTRQRVPAAPRKAAPTKTKPTLNPVTPKPRTRTALQPVSFVVNQTPPRRSVDGLAIPPQHTLIFDNLSKFVALLQMTSSILGSLSLILPKARLLDMTRKLAQRSVGPTSDEYVISSLDLAHEYVVLGKTKRASGIFFPALEVVRSGKVSDDVAIRFLLRFAESLAIIEDIPQSSAVYLEALAISNRMNLEQKAVSTHQRVYARAKILEIAATASHVFSLIQHTLGDNHASIESLLQSLRLWNRAVEALNRLIPSRAEKDSDPFEMSPLKDALPNINSDSSAPPPNSTAVKISGSRRRFADGQEWRISEGLLSTMFALAQAYFSRGSAREAEYFAKQAADLAKQINAPSMISRALTRQGEVQLHMGRLEEAQASLSSASVLLAGIPGLETVEIRKLRAECRLRSMEEGMEEEEGEEDTQELYNQTVAMLEDLDSAFRQFDNLANGPRRSIGMSPGGKGRADVLAPELLASLLSQQLWLLRDNVDETFNSILAKLISLSYSIRNKAEESALMGKLTLHGVYDRFRNDMFLSSLTESTIAVPMGMGSKEDVLSTVQPADVVDALADAEKYFWEHLSITASNGSVLKIRDAALSLALVGAFRTSLGDKRTNVSSMMASLLDISVALTLRRDMLDVIHQKFSPSQFIDDLQWPLLSEDGTSVPRVAPSSSKFSLPPESDSESDEADIPKVKDAAVKSYWDSIYAKYRLRALESSQAFSSEASQLPKDWVVVNITVTSDKGTLFISRQDGGSESQEPLIFCIPLKGRRDHGNGEDEDHLTFDGALQELKDIVCASDECTKSAVDIKADDNEARVNWWKTRGELDVRMRELLENIEYCWLGAFKTILSPRSDLPPEETSELRAQFEKVFYRSLHVKDKKPKPKTKLAHKKSASQTQSNSPHEFSLDDAIIKCFSTLSPKSRDEELEDFVYFILDLYQFHGVPVAIAEVDIDQLVIDVRTVLEEHCARTNKNAKSSTQRSKSQDEHIFLVLDKNVQGLPWESIPILRGRSVSRIPGIQFLHDRLEFAKLKREAAGHAYEPREGAFVDGKKGYYVLNPSGDLGRTEERFRDWANGMKASGWDGVIGKGVTEQQFVNALKTQDIVVYFGHGGGEQYIRSHKIRSLPTCAATMLWGCSSGALRDMGDFDRIGTPYNYMLAGCPTLVANLWDVTDKDIDKLSQAVLDKMGLTGKALNQRTTKNTTSIVAAVSQSRDSCKLKYLTGAAPVVYGLPFYL